MKQLQTLIRIALCLGAAPLATAAGAATFEVVHSFGNGEGRQPWGTLAVDAAGALYGTTYAGGHHDLGTIFRFADGAVTTLHDFKGPPHDGAHAEGSILVDDAGTLYGTTAYGGRDDIGTAFRLSADGDYRTIVSWTGGEDGGLPIAGLTRAPDGTLYGSTEIGGDLACFAVFPQTPGCGTVFKLDPQSRTLTTLHAFHGPEGAGSEATLLLRGRFLYGGTVSGGPGTMGAGAPFSMRTDGSHFAAVVPTEGGIFSAGVARDSGGNFWGVAQVGGGSFLGALYRVDAGGAYAAMHGFVGSDGSQPVGPLVIDDHDVLFGTTVTGGAIGYGTVFQYDIAGATFTTLHSFDRELGAFPVAGLVAGADGWYYGVAAGGGEHHHGVIYRIRP